MLTGTEHIEKMEALLRRIANGAPMCEYQIDGVNICAEAREIVAMLPEPIYGDLIEAREIVAAALTDQSRYIEASNVLEGLRDDDESVICVLDGITRGRALERGE